jgi:hypothetical protein
MIKTPSESTPSEVYEWVNTYTKPTDLEYAMGYVNGLWQSKDYAPPTYQAPRESKMAWKMGFEDGEADAG